MKIDFFGAHALLCFLLWKCILKLLKKISKFATHSVSFYPLSMAIGREEEDKKI